MPRIHAGGADVEGLARAHDGIESFAGLLNGRVLVKAMNLVEVYVVDSKPLQAAVDGGHNVLARQTAVIRRLAHGVENLGRYDQIFSSRLKLTQQLPGEHLAFPERVDIGRVEEVDARFDRPPHKRERLLF